MTQLDQLIMSEWKYFMEMGGSFPLGFINPYYLSKFLCPQIKILLAFKGKVAWKIYLS